MSSYGRKLFLHSCILELFKSKQIDENVFICSQDPLRAVNSERDLATLFCVLKKFSLSAQLASLGYITLYFGEGGPGFLTGTLLAY
jgi:hypothetical protein